MIFVSSERVYVLLLVIELYQNNSTSQRWRLLSLNSTRSSISASAAKGLQAALVHHRQTTVQLQAIEIVGLKRKLAQMQEERDHFRQHCSDLYQRCDEQQEALSSTKSKIVDAIESIVQLEDMIARKHKDCPILKTAVAKVIAELDILEADLTDIVYSDGESDESGSESEEEAPLDEADIPVNDVVVPPAN